jgi:O-antigen/teichoic acid export membrane protein
MLLIGGLRQALLTFYQQTDDEQERRGVFSAAMLLVVVFCAVIGGSALAFAQPMTLLLATERGTISPNLLRLAVLAILLEPFSLMPLALIQSRVHSGKFLVVSVSQFLSRVVLCFLLVGWFQLGAWGVLGATVCTSAVYGVVLSGREILRSGAWPKARHLGGLLLFALPFLPGGLGFLMMQHGDRFFLLKCCGEEEVATYGLGYKLALGVGMFSLGPLYMVWSSLMYQVARQPNAPSVFGRAFTRILAVYTFVGLALCLFQDEVVAVLGSGHYAHAADIIALIVLAGFFQTASSLMDAGFYVTRHSGLKVGITISATLCMSILYVILIPPLGSMGAALATLGGFASLSLITWAVSQRVFPVHYEWGRISCLVVMACVAWLLSRCIPAGWSWAPVKLAMLLAVPWLSWRAGLVAPGEKEYLLGLARVLPEKMRSAIDFGLVRRVFGASKALTPDASPAIVPPIRSASYSQ